MAVAAKEHELIAAKEHELSPKRDRTSSNFDKDILVEQSGYKKHLQGA